MKSRVSEPSFNWSSRRALTTETRRLYDRPPIFRRLITIFKMEAEAKRQRMLKLRALFRAEVFWCKLRLRKDNKVDIPRLSTYDKQVMLVKYNT